MALPVSRPFAGGDSQARTPAPRRIRRSGRRGLPLANSTRCLEARLAVGTRGTVALPVA